MVFLLKEGVTTRVCMEDGSLNSVVAMQKELIFI
jgi:hypothetical protein